MIPIIIMMFVATIIALLGVSIIAVMFPAIGAIFLGVLLIAGSRYIPEMKFWDYKGLSLGTSSIVGMIGLGLIVFTLLGTTVANFLGNILRFGGFISSGSITGGNVVAGTGIDGGTIILFLLLLVGAYFIVIKKKLRK